MAGDQAAMRLILTPAAAPSEPRAGRWLVCTVALLAIMLTTVGSAFAWWGYSRSQTDAAQNVATQASGIATDTERVLIERIALLEAVAASPGVQAGQQLGIAPYLEEVQRRGAGFNGLGWIDTTGQLQALASLDVSYAPVDLSHRDYVLHVLEHHTPYVSQGFFGRLSPTPFIAVAVPTFDRDGQVTGVLFGTMPLDRLRHGAGSLPVGEPDVRIVDRAGQVIADRGVVEDLVDVSGSPLLSEARAAGSGFVEGTGLREEPRQLIGFATVHRAGWVVFAERSRAEVLEQSWTWLTLQLSALFAVAIAGVTAAVAVGRRLDRVARERQAAELVQQEFLAMVGHELKHPLTAMKGYAQLMQKRHSYSAQATDTIVAETNHMQRLVDDLLAIARAQAGRFELERDSVDLADEIAACVAEAQSTTNKHTINFHPVPTNMPMGFWDRDRIRQIVWNLLSNAIKYSPAGGPIEVRIEDFGAVARISVTDQGIGIERNAMPRLFDPFYRAPVTAAGTEGTGLGLGVTKALVEAHGGWIELESSPGRGSTFRVTLPYGTPALV